MNGKIIMVDIYIDMHVRSDKNSKNLFKKFVKKFLAGVNKQ